LNLALPRAKGAQAGTDTAPLRAQALRLVACLVGAGAASASAAARHAPDVCAALSDPGLLLHGWGRKRREREGEIQLVAWLYFQHFCFLEAELICSSSPSLSFSIEPPRPKNLLLLGHDS
jgi:hypothetical protein